MGGGGGEEDRLHPRVYRHRIFGSLHLLCVRRNRIESSDQIDFFSCGPELVDRTHFFFFRSHCVRMRLEEPISSPKANDKWIWEKWEGFCRLELLGSSRQLLLVKDGGDAIVASQGLP